MVDPQRSMKRKRPWSLSGNRGGSHRIAVALIVGLCLPFATAQDATEAPQATTEPPPLITILKEAFPLIFELGLTTTEAFNLNQLINNVDGVLETYLLGNLDDLTVQEAPGLDVRDVTLVVTRKARRSFLRRALQEADTILRVDGNVIYDLDVAGCVECVDRRIDQELSRLLTVENVDRVIKEAEVVGVGEVTSILPASEINYNENNQGNQSQENEKELERPSDLSIIFGFTLTGIAALGLLFYAYVFCRKRQKRLRKLRQQKESIPYKPSTPTRFTPNKRPPPQPNSGTSQAQEFDEYDPGTETDFFAEELKRAASLDQEAWEDFQRKKRALDNGSTNPPPESRPPRSWTKSFPYGDEAPIEFTDQMNRNIDGGWGPYNSNRMSEEKDGLDSLAFSAETSAVLQSIEETLSQYGDSNRGRAEPDLEPEEVVDEVERLSRFVRRYSRRKERAVSRETEILNKSQTDMSVGGRSQFSVDPEGVRGSFQKQLDREYEEKEEGKERTRGYTGITMTGELYQKAFDDSYSDEEGSLRSRRLGISPNRNDDSRYDKNTYKDQFGGGAYQFKPSMDKTAPTEARLRARSDGERYSQAKARLKDLRKNEAIIDSSKSDIVGAQSDVNVGFFPMPGSVAASRQALESKTQSAPSHAPRVSLYRNKKPTSSPSTRSVPTKSTSPPKTPKTPNGKFNNLRNMFEEKSKSKKAVNPPSPSWQSGNFK